MSDLVREVLDILKEVGCSIDYVDLHKSLFLEIGIGSLQFVQLLVLIEEKYNFEFESEDLIIDETITPQGIIRIIDKHIR